MRKNDPLARRIEETHARMAGLLARAAALPEEHRGLFIQTAEDLAMALEELHVAGEELSQQAEELAASRKQAEEDRLRYQELFFSAPEGYIVTDGKAIIQEANAAAAELLHVSPGALVGKPVVLFVDKKDHAAFYRKLGRFPKAGKVEDWEICLKPRRAKAFTASVTVAAVRGADQSVAGLRWLVRDITEEKQRELEAELATFPALSPEPVIEADASGHIYYINDAAARLLPEIQEKGLGHPWFAGLDGIAARFRKTRRTSATREIQIGSKWFEQLVFPVMDGTRLRIYGHDITGRRNAERSLRLSEQKYRDLVENARIIILRWRSDGRITFFNKFAQAFFGYAESEIMGKSVQILVPEEETSGRDLRHLVVDIVTHPESYRLFENENVLRNGERVWVQWTNRALVDESGRVREVLAVGNDITARKRAEEDLRQAHGELEIRVEERTAALDASLKALLTERQRFNDVLNNLPAYVILLRPDRRVAFANRAFKERFGEFDGRRPFETLFGRAETGPERETFRVLETGGPHRWEWTGPDRRDYEVYDFPFPDEDGSRLVLEMGIDVTERKQAEETARHQATRYAAMLTATADGFLIHDLEGRFVDVSDTYCRMTGYSRQELLGMRALEIEAGENAEAVARRIRHLTRTGFDRYESRHRRKDGSIFDVEVSALYVKTASQIMVFVRDITEQKRGREERLRLAAAVAQASEAIALTDVDDTVIYVNEAFLRLHALERGAALGRKYEDVIRLDLEDDAFRTRLHSMRRSGETWKGRLTRKMPDGVERKLEVSVSAVRDASGRVLNFAAIESDATQEHNLELYVRQLQKMEALGTLAGGIAHDFNNILVPIFLNTEMALLDAAKGGALAGYLSLVLEATNRGRELVRQIISFSRQKEQKREPVDIVRVIGEAAKLLRSSTPASIAIHERVLPAAAFVRGDPTQIHQVVMNLGSNAAYAMRQSGGKLEIGLSEVMVDLETAAHNPDLLPGPYLKLTLRDTGTGMTPEVMTKAFDPFFTTKKPGEGTGMGLAVVLGIVKSHGGAISAASEPGKGTTFCVFLPQVHAPMESPDQAAAAIEPGKGNILFVDDEDILRRTVPTALERLGYRVKALSDAHEALALFRKRPEAFDLVITDQTMPRMTGEKLAAEMLRLRPGFPILLCTGFSEAVQEDEAQSLGIAGFILKPFSIGEIAEKIQAVLKPEKTE